jgi:hypothetical protein
MPTPTRLFCALFTAAAFACTQAAAQTVWFCPTIAAPWNNMRGSLDYLDLFAPGAPWATAASHVQIFKMYTQMLIDTEPGAFSDQQLQQIFAFLKANNIALAVEFGPLTPSDTCGNGVEGFGGFAALQLVTRIQQLGGNLQYIAMDEPFSYGSLYSGNNACHWTASQIAANALQSIAVIRSVFPNVIVGDIDVVPNTLESVDWLTQYEAWLDAWTAAAGAPFAFFYFDIQWDIAWQPSVENMRQQLAQRGIPWGIIYNGADADQTSADWINDATNHYVTWEAQGGARPDHVVFQSWHPYPQYVLPETDPTAFTSLIDSYFRQRTSITLTTGPTGASGVLRNTQGSPIASAPVTLTSQATSGEGFVSNYLLTGTVPSSITQALIQTCVNYCGEVGAADLNVYSFQYVDSAGQTNLGFSNGLTGWSVDGNGTALVQTAADSTGTSLRISSTPAQQTFVNSPFLTVTPGSNYNLAIQARISPATSGSGYFAIVFLDNGTEVSRSVLQFAPGALVLGTVQTDADGVFNLTSILENPGMFQLQAQYAGTDSLWPAYASGPADAKPVRVMPCTGCGRGAARILPADPPR